VQGVAGDVSRVGYGGPFGVDVAAVCCVGGGEGGVVALVAFVTDVVVT
jgi:hypothetical protein